MKYRFRNKRKIENKAYKMIENNRKIYKFRKQNRNSRKTMIKKNNSKNKI